MFMEERKYTTPYTWDILAIDASEAKRQEFIEEFTELIGEKLIFIPPNIIRGEK